MRYRRERKNLKKILIINIKEERERKRESCEKEAIQTTKGHT